MELALTINSAYTKAKLTTLHPNIKVMKMVWQGPGRDWPISSEGSGRDRPRDWPVFCCKINFVHRNIHLRSGETGMIWNLLSGNLPPLLTLEAPPVTITKFHLMLYERVIITREQWIVVGVQIVSHVYNKYEENRGRMCFLILLLVGVGLYFKEHRSWTWKHEVKAKTLVFSHRLNDRTS